MRSNLGLTFPQNSRINVAGQVRCKHTNLFKTKVVAPSAATPAMMLYGYVRTVEITSNTSTRSPEVISF